MISTLRYQDTGKLTGSIVIIQSFQYSNGRSTFKKKYDSYYAENDIIITLTFNETLSYRNREKLVFISVERVVVFLVCEVPNDLIWHRNVVDLCVAAGK